MVQSVLKPPQIPAEEEFEALVLKYMTDYRCIYIEHPRIRYDGVYIAVCHYMYVSRLISVFSHVRGSSVYTMQTQRRRGERLDQRTYPTLVNATCELRLTM